MSNPFVVGPSTSETVSQSLPTFTEFAWDFEKTISFTGVTVHMKLLPARKLSRCGCCMYSGVNGIGILPTLMIMVSSLKSLSVQARMMGREAPSFSAM